MLDQGDMYGSDGCSDPKYCRDGKPKPFEELTPKTKQQDQDDNILTDHFKKHKLLGSWEGSIDIDPAHFEE